ncbi:hypothetical protein AVEN_226773-1 [Araneus ventricosus]|uniref:Uncharacterized protein n=1 Tax=Araneus ventricosus TaxID=182803 RepID=A0A4Y2S7L2_ARAVE|nr:hypothetical protein AVEN_226773-1 [Araneus ventricosus]
MCTPLKPDVNQLEDFDTSDWTAGKITDLWEKLWSKLPQGGVEIRLPFPSLDNGTLVDHQLTFLVVNPYSEKVLEFRHHRPIRDDTKGYR